jgi:hypothetical protein
MTEYGDASLLFPLYDDVSLFVDDVLMPITRIRHEHSGKFATWIDFEARADDGSVLLGSLYTRQDRDDVEALVREALDNGKFIEIRGRQVATRVPNGARFWIVGELLSSGAPKGDRPLLASRLDETLN